MILGVRRLLAALAIGMALLIGAPSVFAAAAPTPDPTTSATAKSTAKSSASPSASSEVDSNDDTVDTGTDAAPDNSRTLWLLGGAGVIAVAAAAVVIARR
jgi:hypothetical protein